MRAPDKYLTIDAAALVNLELLENNDNFSSQGTLLEVLDHCVTPMGTLHIIHLCLKFIIQYSLAISFLNESTGPR